ncbi:MAG: glycosyltransferase family 2 protein [Lachnospiraceae bacterium]|nr:glycosyltransferase family 2 protein [Lachnospiraceae bacterium]
MDLISLIIPCYNEQESIPHLEKALNELTSSMSEVNFEIILVDNCSEDNTLKMMKELHEKDNRYQYISFSRNFGKDSSMYAGLKASKGDYVAVMDADLQDPPELLKEMYAIVKTGEYDCVATKRGDRKGEPWLRSVLARMFYGLMNKISSYEIVDGARDFRLMTRQMVNGILKLEESERFTKGIFSWVGFRTKWLTFENHERVAGETKLPMKSAFNYAIRGIVAFSTVPLVMASGLGILVFFAAILYTLYVIIFQLITHEAVSGYPSLMCVMLFGFGVIMMILGVIGQYMAQMYLEIKNRPKYIIRDTSIEQ